MLIFLIKMEVSLCLRPDSERFFCALADQLLAPLLTVKTVPVRRRSFRASRGSRFLLTLFSGFLFPTVGFCFLLSRFFILYMLRRQTFVFFLKDCCAFQRQRT